MKILSQAETPKCIKCAVLTSGTTTACGSECQFVPFCVSVQKCSLANHAGMERVHWVKLEEG